MFLAYRRTLRTAFPVLAAGTALFLVTVNASAAHLERDSIRELAANLRPQLRAGDQIASYAAYFQDLPVYLERRIIVVNWAGELEFGMSVEDTSGWMMSDRDFWNRWYGTETLYLFTKRDVYEWLKAQDKKNLFPVAGNEETILLSNKEKLP